MREKHFFLKLAGSAALASLPLLVLLLCMTELLGTYGLVLFVGLPFLQGFLAAFLLARFGFPRLPDQVVAAVFSLLFSASWLILLRVGDLIWVIMAAPMALILSLLGAVIYYGASIASGGRTDHPIRILSVLLPNC
ncbi:MAG TPA: hypothetical protein VLU25_21875 [Acidobacteriota bacterium]|nr:hypothetical protein [Acidobacteriota bacterium]